MTYNLATEQGTGHGSQVQEDTMHVQIPAKNLTIGQHFCIADNTESCIVESVTTTRKGRRTVVTARTVKTNEAREYEFIGQTPVRVNTVAQPRGGSTIATTGYDGEIVIIAQTRHTQSA
ncbi:MAG: hypothetical protein KGL39_23105 [Patescibacteria group bacterium]|nr:hypothetical protein [Patescibacteria group bacterium]